MFELFENLTMARSAAIQSQNNAPGPPVAIAVATPDILDTPTVPPIAMELLSVKVNLVNGNADSGLPHIIVSRYQSIRSQ